LAQMKITKNGETTGSVDEWKSRAPPRRRDQWKDGRSAKELAKAWFPPAGEIRIPVEFSELLQSSDVLGDVKLYEGEPEVVVHFDSFRDQSRNCDLLVLGVCKIGKIVISVEAKADERFGDTVGRTLDKGVKKEGSKIPERICRLTSSVLGVRVGKCRELRYQLLYGTAAALSAAKKHDAVAAIFVVHEFVTTETRVTKLKQNAKDLDKFVCTVSPDHNRIYSGHLLGPFRVPGNTDIPRDIDLFIGKATRKT
jgi:hypothetical protein